MSKRNLLSTIIIGFSILLFIMGKLINLDTFIAKKLCGNKYLLEPEAANFKAGIMTENACGFNADIYFVVFVILLFTIGVLVFMITKIPNFNK